MEEKSFEKRVEVATRYFYRNGEKLSRDCFYFNSRGVTICYPFSDICFVETSPHPHRVMLHTKTEHIELATSLTDILSQELRFVRCHRSFLINPANVVKVDRRQRLLFFSNGMTCLVSRQRLKLILRCLDAMHQSEAQEEKP